MWKLISKSGDTWKYYEEVNGSSFWASLPLLKNKDYFFIEIFTKEKSYKFVWYWYGVTIKSGIQLWDSIQEFKSAIEKRTKVTEVRLTFERWTTYKTNFKDTPPLNDFTFLLVTSLYSGRDDIDKSHGYTDEEIAEKRGRKIKRFMRETHPDQMNRNYFYNILYGKYYQ